MTKELFFSDEAKVKKVFIFDVEDVEGIWVAEDPIELDVYAKNMEFTAVEIGKGKKARWSVSLDVHYTEEQILEKAQYAEEIFHIPWEAWQVEYLE